MTLYTAPLIVIAVVGLFLAAALFRRPNRDATHNL